MIDSRPMVKEWARRSHVAGCPIEVALTSKAARVWCDGCNTKAPKSGAIVFMSVCLSLQVLPRDLHDMQPEQSPSGAVDRLLRRTLAWLTLASGLKDIYDRPVERSRCGCQLAYHTFHENRECSLDGRMLHPDQVGSSARRSHITQSTWCLDVTNISSYALTLRPPI